jgi:hypothetical protein
LIRAYHLWTVETETPHCLASVDQFEPYSISSQYRSNREVVQASTYAVQVIAVHEDSILAHAGGRTRAGAGAGGLGRLGDSCIALCAFVGGLAGSGGRFGGLSFGTHFGSGGRLEDVCLSWWTEFAFGQGA